MVKEKTSPMARFQGSWKLPGGLADPGENFADTVAREVFEETRVTGKLVGVVSLRHTHDYRFGQGDMYVSFRLPLCIVHSFYLLWSDRGYASRV